MGKLVLLIIFGLVVAFYFPNSRQMMFDKSKPVLAPFYRWQTRHEMEGVVRGLRDHERDNFGRLPGRREWAGWLEDNYFGDLGRDAWGQAYFYRTRRDSFYITSSGPDLVYQTEDDVTLAAAMSRPDRN